MSAVAGCSSGASVEPGGKGGTEPGPLALWASGSRIQAVVLDAGDGAFAFSHLHDSALGVDCYLGRTEDGVTRCLPFVPSVLFSDSLCQQAIIEMPTSCPPQRYGTAAVSDTGSVCDHRTAVYEATGSVPPPQVLYARIGSECVSLPPDTLSPAYAAATKLAPSQLVAMEVVRETVDADFAVDLVLGEDGSRMLGSVVDRDGDRACAAPPYLSQLQLSESLCLPTDAAWMYNDVYYADDSCTAPIAFAYCSDGPEIVFDLTEGGCEPAIREPGPSVVDAYQGDGGLSCEPLQGSVPEYSFYQAGPELPASAFPVLSSTPQGQGRILAYYWGTSEGTPVASAGTAFFDTERDEPCFPFEVAAGVFRCLPSAHSLAVDYGYYADPACGVELVETGTNECDGPPRTLAVRRGSYVDLMPCETQPTIEVREVGGPFEGTVYLRDSGQCFAIDPAAGQLFHFVGQAIPLASFPLLEVRALD